jgi:hypothetical protein
VEIVAGRSAGKAGLFTAGLPENPLHCPGDTTAGEQYTVLSPHTSMLVHGVMLWVNQSINHTFFSKRNPRREPLPKHLW